MHVVTLTVSRLVRGEICQFGIGSILVPDHFDIQIQDEFDRWRSEFPETAIGHFGPWFVKQHPELSMIEVESAFIDVGD